MRSLKDILKDLKKDAKKIQISGVVLKLTLDQRKLTTETISLLRDLLNQYQDDFFISLENVPFCLMPDCLEHMAGSKKMPGFLFKGLACNNCDFKDRCGGCADVAHFDKRHLGPLREIPSEIVLEVTTKCNLGCKACTRDKVRKDHSLNFSTAKRIMDEAKALGIKTIRFTGGEPLLNDDIKKMLIYAKNSNFYVQLNTNATNITDGVFPILAKTVDNVLVSLQGYNYTTNNQLTDSCLSFNGKIINILKLKYCVPVLRLGTVISGTLMQNFDRYVILIKKLGIRYWDLFRPMPQKHGQGSDISKRDILSLMKLIYKSNKEGLNAKISNPVPFCITKDTDLSLATLLGSNFDDGHSRLVFDPRGYYKPSYFIDIKLGGTIREAWENPFIKNLRSLKYLPKKCKVCDYLKWCKGGSRAASKNSYNDYFRLDPLV